MVTRTLIYGPPGAGKSTHAATLGEYLELEQFGNDRAFRSAVVNSATPVVVRCCFTPTELLEWQALTRATSTVLIDPGDDVCRVRIIHRARADWRGELVALQRWRDGWASDITVSGRW